MVWVIVTFAIFVFVAVAAAYVLLKARRSTLGFSNIDFSGLDHTSGNENGKYIRGFITREDKQSQLMHAKVIGGTVYRWHDRSKLPPSNPLWRTFLDDNKKWSNQARFAGKDFNCGHFFAFSEAVANAEAKHYGINMDSVELLEIKLVVDKILDFTDPGGMRLAYEAVVENPDASDPFIAEELIEVDTGGTILTDRIGHWALTKGYNGIIFVASRAIWGPEQKKKEGVSPTKPWDYDPFHLYLPIYRENNQLIIVLFRGTWLLGRIIKYKIGNHKWEKNDYYRKTPEEIDCALSVFSEYKKYDLAFQDRKRVISVSGGIQYVKRPG